MYTNNEFLSLPLRQVWSRNCTKRAKIDKHNLMIMADISDDEIMFHKLDVLRAANGIALYFYIDIL